MLISVEWFERRSRELERQSSKNQIVQKYVCKWGAAPDLEECPGGMGEIEVGARNQEPEEIMRTCQL